MIVTWLSHDRHMTISYLISLSLSPLFPLHLSLPSIPPSLPLSPTPSILPPFPLHLLSPSSPSLPASFQEMVLDALLAGRAVAITAVYYLMQGRLARYKRLTAKVPHATVSRMKKSRSYAGPTTTEAELVAAHVDPGRAPVQRVSHQLDQPRFVEWGCC